MKKAVKSITDMRSMKDRKTSGLHSDNRNITMVIEEKKEKITALIGGYFADKEAMCSVRDILTHFGKKCLFYKDIEEKYEIASVIIIFNSNRSFEYDVDAFINYAIFNKVPIVAIYTNIINKSEIHDANTFSSKITSLWKCLPSFDNERFTVPTVHITLNELSMVVRNNDFEVGTNLEPSDYYIL